MSRELSIVIHLTIDDDDAPEDDRWELDNLAEEVLFGVRRALRTAPYVRIVDHEVITGRMPDFAPARDEESPTYRQHMRDAGRGGLLK